MDDVIECVRCDAELHVQPGRVYRAVLIRPGDWLGKNMRCPAAVLQAAAARFDGLASFLNPPAPQPGQHGHPMLERLLGVTENAHWDDSVPPAAGGTESGGIVADYRLADTAAAREFRGLVDGWLAARAAGHPVPAIGLSAVPWVRLGPPGADGIREVREIVRVDQVDAVYRPAAGGEFLQVLNSEHSFRGGMAMNQDVLHETAAAEPVAEGQATGQGVAFAQLIAAARQSALDARLAASGLPERWRGVVRASLGSDWALDQLDATIARVRAAWAQDEAAATVQGIRPLGGTRIDGMQTGLD